MGIWYSAGTVSVDAGSDTVRGTGTQWIENTRQGDAIVLGGEPYEIKQRDSDVIVRLVEAYRGPLLVDAAYRVMPVNGYPKEIADRAAALLASYGAGIEIRGTLESEAELPAKGSSGDAYIIGSDIYVWSSNAWSNAGTIRGPQGDQGPQGIQGPQGQQGVQGDVGPIGPRGIQGERGEQGLQGPQGDQGIQGEQGPQGIQGIQGEQGPQGLQGEQGIQGPQGERGASFQVDAVGLFADRSAYDGEPEGFAFLATDVGELYLRLGMGWSDGVPFGKGDKGDDGADGPMGPEGPQGIQGPQGERGADGAQGPAGADGLQGAPGAAGQDGAPGEKGEQGPPGDPAPPVVADWNATSGPSAILNKPTLGTAAAASTTDFATSAQGAKADSAIQQVKTLNGESLAGPGNIALPPGQTRKFRRFTNSGTFTPTAAHLAAGGIVDYVVVGGGGGGGKSSTGVGRCGGGGGGAVLQGTLALTGSVSVVVGAGGEGQSSVSIRQGLDGGQSSLGSIIALGGGGGGGGGGTAGEPATKGRPGGCGGGDGHSSGGGGGGGSLHSASYTSPSLTGIGSQGGSGAEGGASSRTQGGVGILGYGFGGNGSLGTSAYGPGAAGRPNTGEGGGGGSGTGTDTSGGNGGSGVVELSWFE